MKGQEWRRCLRTSKTVEKSVNKLGTTAKREKVFNGEATKKGTAKNGGVRILQKKKLDG